MMEAFNVRVRVCARGCGTHVCVCKRARAACACVEGQPPAVVEGLSITREDESRARRLRFFFVCSGATVRPRRPLRGAVPRERRAARPRRGPPRDLPPPLAVAPIGRTSSRAGRDDTTSATVRRGGGARFRHHPHHGASSHAARRLCVRVRCAGVSARRCAAATRCS